MTSLVILPRTSDAFSQYRPSRAAHTDFIDHSTSQTRKAGQSAGPKTIRLSFQSTSILFIFPFFSSPSASPSSSTTQDKLKDLLDAIPLLLQGKSTARSFHYLSDTCHRLILSSHDHGQEIYRRVKEELDKSVSLLAREWRASIMGKEGGWLGRLVHGWESWEARAVSCFLRGIHRVQPIRTETSRCCICLPRQSICVHLEDRDDLVS